MMDINLIIFGLFPGICFSVFYLKGIREFARNDSIKLLSYHTFLAAIYITLFLMFASALSWLINTPLKLYPHIRPISTEVTYISILGLYLSSFYIAYKLGNYLCLKKFLYPAIKPNSHWNKIFEKPDDSFEFFISTIVETGGKTWLYVGLLQDYLTKEGELDYIQIAKPFRREIKESEDIEKKKKKPFKERFYEIDVDTLIIKYTDIRSLGIKKVQS